MRHLRGEVVPLTAEEEANRDALQAKLDRLSEEYQDANELPDEVDERLSELETLIEGFDNWPVVFDAAEIARAGAFVGIGTDGQLRVERATSGRKMSCLANPLPSCTRTATTGLRP